MLLAHELNFNTNRRNSMQRSKFRYSWLILISFLIAGLTPVFVFAQDVDFPQGSFENADLPFLWNTGTTGTTAAQFDWATDKSRSDSRSAKIVKSDTDGEAFWISDNMNKYWTRSWGAGANGDIDLGGFPANLLLEVGGWIQFSNINTTPGSDDEMIYLAFSFYDSTGALLFGQDVVVPFPQDQATLDTWTEIKSDPFTLPLRAATLNISFKFGAQATGTAWVDDVFLRKFDPAADGWSGDIFNNSFNAPDGWFYWWADFITGNVPVTATISDEEAHNGQYSLRITEDDDDSDEVVYISDFLAVDATKNYILTAWVKTKDFSADSAAVNTGYRIGFTVNWMRGVPGWQEIRAEDMQFTITDSTTDWTQYAMALTPPEDATHICVRARYWAYATGTSYWDDFAITEVTPSANILANPGFDSSDLPHFWSTETTGTTAATLEWATDKSRSESRSAKISKSDQDGTASWVSEDMNRYWTKTWGAGAGGNDDLGGFAPNLLLEVGGWVQTEGINVNPATDEETVYLAFSFFDSSGAQIFGQDVVVPLPQDSATTDSWTEIKSDPLTLPVRAARVTIAFVFGQNATGTAWVDDVFLRKTDPAAGGWEGDIYNNSFNAPTGWFYWWDNFIRGNIPVVATISDEEAHSGTYSLKVNETDNDSDELVFISDHTPVVANQNYVFSAWVKTIDFSADSAAVNNGFKIGFTVNWHSSAPGWHEQGSQDMRFTIADSATDWTQYVMPLTAPEGVTHVTVRARYWANATGTSYWDDFSFVPVMVTAVNAPDEMNADGVNMLPTQIELSQNYPNPFNPSTTIVYRTVKTSHVSMAVYSILGRKVRTLVDQALPAGTHRIKWNGLDDRGIQVSNGIYFYQLQVGNSVIARSMLLLK